VAAGPVGRQGSAATDVSLAEIYSYARTRGLFGGIAVDGSVIAIDKAANEDLYGKKGVTATEIFSGKAPSHRRPRSDPYELSQATHTVARSSPAPQAEVPAATAQAPAPSSPAADAPRTYPLDAPNNN